MIKKALAIMANRRRLFRSNTDISGYKQKDAAAALLLAGIINILPLLFFFIAFMFVIANVMQIAIAILIAGVGIVLIRYALRGTSKYIKKFKSGKDSGGEFLFQGDY